MTPHQLLLTVIMPCLFFLTATAQIETPVSIPDSAKNDRSVANTVMTRWVSPDNSRPTGFAEWQSRSTDKSAFSIREVESALSGKDMRDGVGFDIIINETLYYQIESSITRYHLELTGEGYAASLFLSDGGTPEDMRGFLQGRYLDHDVEGFVFIGDLPIAWYEGTTLSGRTPDGKKRQVTLDLVAKSVAGWPTVTATACMTRTPGTSPPTSISVA